jgi:hypothetical protein
MRAGASRTLGALLVLAAGPGCSSDPGIECSCADPTVTVVVPSDRASSVVSVEVSGEGCPAVTPVCLQPVGAGCAEAAFRGTALGMCTVDVQLSSGPADFTTTFEFVRYPCCKGFYPELTTGSTIQVPELSDDAGAGE